MLGPIHLTKRKQRPARRAVVIGRICVVDYLNHGRTFLNQRANAGFLIRPATGLQIILGKVRPFTSPGRGPSTDLRFR